MIITCGEGLGVSVSPGVTEADELVIYDLGRKNPGVRRLSQLMSALIS